MIQKQSIRENYTKYNIALYINLSSVNLVFTERIEYFRFGINHLSRSKFKIPFSSQA